ncbi:MAG: hypothetical protein B7Y85_11550 [Brevundimonas sp. 32-68-21]|nr:MAG: hypothetical protein B7Y85_11550 [Brevundimonas sp. 32-68-21]
MNIFTIGYEGATQAQVIDRLKAAGVDLLIDVRAVAVLGESLKVEGIDYLHLRGLGTPKTGREAARKGRIGEMRAIFADHLAEPQAQMEYERLKALAGEKRVALLCFEADHAGCHRAVLAERLADETGAAVIDL